MSLDFDLTSKRIRNLKVLQSINSNVFEIVEDVSHVALYKYENGSGSKWERVDVEGSAFVTRNKESPFYSLIVLNKKGPTDFVLDLTPKIKVKVQDIYVMIRCNAEVIIGLWFHDEEERSCLFQQLKRITTADGNSGSSGGFAASLLKLQAQAASKDNSPLNSKEPAEKMKYSDIVTKKLKEETKSSPVTYVSSPSSEDTTNTSVASNYSSVKKNLLLSALRPSCSETELKDKAVPESADPAAASRPVGLSLSENNLGRLLLEGISTKKTITVNVSDVKKVLFNESNGNGGGGVGSKNSSTDSMTTTASGGSGCSAGIAAVDGDNGAGSGSARLLSLLKASGRNTQNTAAAAAPLNTNSTSSGSTPVALSSQDSPLPSPPQCVSPVNGVSTAAGHNGASLSEAQRSDRLLAMLKHATTSNQAMDLLTDGDIANKQLNKNNNSNTTAAVATPPVAPSSGEGLGKKSSSDRLMSMLKGGPSVGTTPVPSAVPAGAGVVVSSPVDKKLSDVASKENQLKNLLALNGVSPAKSPAVTPLPTPATISTTTSPGVVNKVGSEERTVNLLSSLSAVKRSPELRPLNSGSSSTATSGGSALLKSASPSTVGGGATVNKAAVKPLLLSPSDLLAKLTVA